MGIDLGSANVTICLENEGIVLREPSYVLPSAGSAFKRPEGHYAGALIEQAGLKGYSVGGAQVSEKHAGFVVNVGGATSHDVYDLMMHVRNTVYRESGVQLEPEIIILPPDYKLEDHSPKALKNQITVNAPAEE